MSDRPEPLTYRSEACTKCQHPRDVVSGDWMRWKRERSRFGLRELAVRLGLSAAYLSDVERNKRNVTPALHESYTKLRVVR